MNTWVYVACCSRGGPDYRVGCCRDPMSRLGALRSQVRQPVHILGMIKGGPQHEMMLRAVFPHAGGVGIGVKAGGADWVVGNESTMEFLNALFGRALRSYEPAKIEEDVWNNRAVFWVVENFQSKCRFCGYDLVLRRNDPPPEKCPECEEYGWRLVADPPSRTSDALRRHYSVFDYMDTYMDAMSSLRPKKFTVADPAPAPDVVVNQVMWTARDRWGIPPPPADKVAIDELLSESDFDFET